MEGAEILIRELYKVKKYCREGRVEFIHNGW